MDTAPFTRSLDNRVDAIFELISVVDESTDFGASLNETLRIVTAGFERTDKDDVVDDTFGDLALTIREIDQDFSDCLSDFDGLTLSHCETIEAVVLTTASEAEVFSDTGTITKLIIPGCEVELNEVSAFIDKIADLNFVDEVEFPKRLLVEESVDVDRVFDWTSAFFEELDNIKHLTESFHLIAIDLLDDTEFFEEENVFVTQI